MNKIIERENNNLEEFECNYESINGYKPLSREHSLAPNTELTIELTKEQINKIVFYKRLIISKNEILLKTTNISDKDIKEVIKHIVGQNYDVLNPEFARCIDDRSLEEQHKGVYTPGGTDGILAAALHLLKEKNINLYPQSVYDILIDSIGGESNYYSHSDTHNINKEGRIGCGHCDHTFNNGEHLLNLRSEDIDFMIKLRKQTKENSKIDILEGEHKAKGVILVDNTYSPDNEKISIVPKGKDGQYFIYNRNAEKNILSRFIKELNKHDEIQHLTLNENELDNIAFKAYLSTLEHLGAGKLPHFTIKYNKDESRYQLKSVGNVDKFIENHQL